MELRSAFIGREGRGGGREFGADVVCRCVMQAVGAAVVMWLEEKATPTAIAGGCCDVMIVVVMDDEARGEGGKQGGGSRDQREPATNGSAT